MLLYKLQKIRISLFSLFVLFIQHAFASPHEVVIIGSGVGGLTAALYLARGACAPLVIEGSMPGGAITESNLVENWPGERSISGTDLAGRIRKQAKEFGALFLQGEVTAVDFSKRPFSIRVGEKELYANYCIIATGSTPHKLAIPGEDLYWGRGVSTCAVCDGALYQGLPVAVVGGGDTAVSEALLLNDLGCQVFLFVRGKELSGSDATLRKKIQETAEINVFYETTVTEIQGNGSSVTGISYKTLASTPGKKSVRGVFLGIGREPNTSLFQHKLATNKDGALLVSPFQETSVPGVFAVGDVCDSFYRQAITAAGDGAKAALSILQKGSWTNTSLISQISSKKELQKLRASTKGKLAIEFYSPTCPPCKALAPQLENKAKSAKNVHFAKVDISTAKDLAQEYTIRSIPTLIIFNEDLSIASRKEGLEPILLELSKLP